MMTSVFRLLQHIWLGFKHVLALLFLPSHRSFETVHELMASGYQVSYLHHCRTQHNLRFGTLAYSLVLACGIAFLTIAVQISYPEQFNQPVYAATLTVNSTADDDDGSCSAAPGDCTLREAIAYASPGDTIQFGSALTINLSSNLPAVNDDNLIIAGTEAADTIIDCRNIANTAFNVTADNVTIRKLTVQNCNLHGIRFESNADNFTLDILGINNNASGGVSIMNGQGGTITNSMIRNNNGVGIFSPANGGGRSGLMIDDNDLIDNLGDTGDGISLSQSTNVTISNNYIAGNSKNGIRLIGGSQNIIDKNIIGTERSGAVNGNDLGGIALQDGSSLNQITNNTVVANGMSGIHIAGSDSNTISNNSIGYLAATGTYALNGSHGMLVEQSSFTIIGADLNDNYMGNTIRTADSVSAISISGSTATSNIHRKNTFDQNGGKYVEIIGGANPSIQIPSFNGWYGDTVYGTVDAGATIDVYGGQPTIYIGTTAANSAGNWQFTHQNLANHANNGAKVAVVASLESAGSSTLVEKTEETLATISDIAIDPDTISAVITWTTNVVTDGAVTVNDTTVTEEYIGESHSVTLTDLQSGTDYDCEITSKDVVIPENVATSDACSFTTQDEAGPIISSVAVEKIFADTATITWVTDEAATSQVDYGLTDSYGSSVASDELTTSHSVTLTDLSAETTYHFRVVSTDAIGNASNSADDTFTTTEQLAYRDEVASTVTINDSANQTTVVSGSDGDDVILPKGDLTFSFSDSKQRLTNHRLHFVLALVKKKQDAIVDRKKAFDDQGNATITVKQEKLDVEKKYVVSTGILNAAGEYVNPTGLAERFTFTLKDVPQLLSPSSTIAYRMPEKFIVASKAQSVTVTLKKTSGEELFHCTAEMTDGVGECSPPFGVQLGQYLLTLTDARGGTVTQDFYVSDVAVNNTLTTDIRSDKFYHRIIYSDQPTFIGLTTAGHTVELYIPQIDGAMQATVAAGDAATTWNFTLKLTTLPIGVTTMRMVDRNPDGSVAQEDTYAVFRTHRPVQPQVNDPAANSTFQVAPVIQVIGPNDHIVELTNAAGTLLSEAQYQNGERRYNLAEWFTQPGTYTVNVRNRNSLNLPSGQVPFTFTLAAKAAAQTTETTTETTETTEITDSKIDTDKDGLTDVQEETEQSDPNVADTDGDGVQDGEEIANKTSPIDFDTDDDGLSDNADGGIEDELQEKARVTYEQTGEEHVNIIPVLTKKTVEAEADLDQKLYQQISTTTTTNIVPGTDTIVTDGAVQVVTQTVEISIVDWLSGREPAITDTTTFVLSGTVVLPDSVKSQTAYVVVAIFSAPIVKIAQVDTNGQWTMTVPAELLTTGEHTALAALEVNGTRSEQVEVAKFVINHKSKLSNTSWLIIVNVIVAVVALLLAIIIHLRRKRADKMYV